MTAPVEPLLGLCMIVRSESSGIAETLAPLVGLNLGKLPDGKLTPEWVVKNGPPLIDRFTIVDTGSTDDTKDKIAEIMAAAAVPGALVDQPWVDFSTNRNQALDLHALSTRFVLMLDADDILTGGDVLRAYLEQLVASGAPLDPAYRVTLRGIRNSDDDYALPLVITTAMAPRYVGRVHECLMAATTTTIPGVVITKVAKPKSIEASARRWTRDRAVLQEMFKADPTNARTVFYLAQTYECMGEKYMARKFYHLRARMPGWPEEAFEAQRRLAKLAEDPALKVMENLRAHQMDPRRAEPLYAIAEHFYAGDQHALTYLFASRAAALPEPVTSMFTDREVYRWKANDLAAISAYYLAHNGQPDLFETGRAFALAAVNARPDDQRLRANLTWYARSASDTFAGVTLTPVDHHPEAPYHPGSPSICNVNGRLLAILRTTNYQIVDGQYLTPDDNVIFTKNVMLELGEDLSVARAVPMEDLPVAEGAARTDYPVHGYEDCRLFEIDGELYATATVCDFPGVPAGDGAREIVLLHINKDSYAIESAEPVRGPWSEKATYVAQKNWMPVASQHGGYAEFIFATDPQVAQIYVGINGTPTMTGTTPAIGRLRGGSQLVRVHADTGRPTYLCIVHDVVFPGGNARIYSHRFVVIEAGAVTAMSDRFYFKQRGIEFCAGLALGKGGVTCSNCGDSFSAPERACPKPSPGRELVDTGRGGHMFDVVGPPKLIASFSVNDASSYFATFDLDDVLSKCHRKYVI